MTAQGAALSRIKTNGEALTRRQREILALMAEHEDDDGELVYENGDCWLGLERVAPRTFFALLRACVIRLDGGEVGGVERYRINETGLALIKPATG